MKNPKRPIFPAGSFCSVAPSRAPSRKLRPSGRVSDHVGEAGDVPHRLQAKLWILPPVDSLEFQEQRAAGAFDDLVEIGGGHRRLAVQLAEGDQREPLAGAL